jgi:uncharacterized protein YgbK (DUF1537 family)
METFEPSMGRVDGVIVSHAFLTEMSRITVNRIHMLRIMGPDKSFYYRPVHLTKFAEDRRFGYPTSDMAEYVEYRFSNSGLGFVKADDVLHLNLELLRKGGPEEVKKNLLRAKKGRIVTVDIFSKRDLQVLTLGLLTAEKCGKNYIYRSAASLPPARVNMEDIPVLNKNDVLRSGGPVGKILCLWGSIIELSNMQLEETLQRVQSMTPISFDVKRVLESEEEKEDVIVLTVNRTEGALKSGKHALVYTVPRSEYPSGNLSNGERASNQQTIASALQEVYNRLTYNPTVVIFKGGVTSSTGLFNSGSKKVYVLGQVSPGIPIVKILPMDNERFPGKETLMILGPGNVGKADTYVEVVEKLAGE